MRVGDDGHVEDWPIAEVSSTVAPAELRMQPISARGMQALRALEGVPEGRFTMSMLDNILGRKSVEEDVEETTEVEDVELDAEEEEAEEQDEATTEVAEDQDEANIEEVAEEIARHLELNETVETLVRAIQQVDETVANLDSRLSEVEQTAETIKRSEPERVRQFVQSKDWAKQLYSARRSGEEIDEDQAEDVKERNNSSSEGEDGVFGAVKFK
jgi:hypothetical protein